VKILPEYDFLGFRKIFTYTELIFLQA